MPNDVSILFAVKYIGDEYLGIMGLSSFLKKHGYEVSMVDADYKSISRALSGRDQKTILAYSAPTIFVDYYLQLNRKIKSKFDVFSLFGGPHPTAFADMVREDGVDGVCVGEGEFALLELADSLRKGKDLRFIKNLWIKNEDGIFKNPLRPLIDDLDALPFVDRTLFGSQAIRDPERMHIMAGRGCPYSCGYCFNYYYNTALYPGQGAVIRKRSVKNIIEELLILKKSYPVRFIIFDDDILVLPKGWFKEFSSDYKKYVGLPFFCNIRADIVTQETVALLKEAGCFSVAMGIEAADENARNIFLGRHMSRDQMIDAARMIKAAGIRLKASNIIGIPGTCIDRDFDTLKLNIACNVDYASVNILAFYPKTKTREIFLKDSHIEDIGNKARKRQLYNLRCLFFITVRFPCIFGLTRVLVRLPFGFIYRCVYLLFSGCCFYFLIFPAGFRSFFQRAKKYLLLLLSVGCLDDIVWEGKYPFVISSKERT